MGVSAYQDALAKGEQYRAGIPVAGDYYWSREQGRWLVRETAGVPANPPPDGPPVSEVVRSLAPWVAVAGAAGLALWWWKR